MEKTCKRLLSFLVALFMVLSMVPTNVFEAVAATTEVDCDTAGHSIELLTAAVPAGCLVPGKTAVYTCTVCGCYFEDAEGKKEQENAAPGMDFPDGHKLTFVGAAAETCTANGNTAHYLCDVCNKAYATDDAFAKDAINPVIPALGHSYTTYIYNNDATYEADGTETATCDNGCGTTHVRNVEGTMLVKNAAQIGDVKYATLQEALEAAKSMSGDVVVEIFEKVTLTTALTGNYDSIKFVGKDNDAEIYLDVQGYVTATGKKVAFEDLALSKSAGGFIGDAGFMNLAFGIFSVEEVIYTNCYFANGAYASSGDVIFNGCTFMRSHDRYGMWAYGDVDVLVDGCTFADFRGIKVYSEGMERTAAVTVKNTDFSAVNNKPAIVLTSGESITLENNTYSATGVFELDLDGVPDGTPVTSDVAPTCINDNGACGVMVDGKIYTTAAKAAEVAVAGSNVTLLHDSQETVEFAENVNLDKNGFAAEDITVKIAKRVAQTMDAQGNVLGAYADFEEALAAACADANVVRIEVLADYETDTVANTSDYYYVKQALTIGVAAGENYTVTVKPAADSIAICLQNGGSLTLEEGLTINHLDVFSNGFWTNGENTVINGELHAVSLKQWTSNGTITIGETGKVVLGYSDGQLDMNYGSGDIIVNGTLTDTSDLTGIEPQVKAGYITSQSNANGNTLALNNTYVEGGAWVAVGGRNGNINLNGSVLKVSGGDSESAMALGSSGNKLLLTNGSRLIVATLTIHEGNSLQLDASSKVEAKLTGAGTLIIDATGMQDGDTLAIADVTGFTGTIQVIGSDLGAEIVDGKVVLKAASVAKIGNTGYLTIEEALAAAEDNDVITLLQDVSMEQLVKVENIALTIAGDATLTLNDKLEVYGETTLNISCAIAGSVTLGHNAILKDSTINGDVFVAGKVTFRGDNTVNMLSDFGTLTDYYGTVANMEWSVEPGASLKMLKAARYGLGYGDKVTINGTLSNALTARDQLTEEDMSFFTNGLVGQESKGWNQTSYFTVNDAYVMIGSNNSFGNKPGNYGGTYYYTFDNVVLDGSRITFYEALSTSTMTFNASDVKIGTFMTKDADSVFMLNDTKLVSTATTNGSDENNTNGGQLILNNSSISYAASVVNTGLIQLDATSSITISGKLTGAGKIVIDATNYTYGEVEVITGDVAGFTGTIEVIGNALATYELTETGIKLVPAAAPELPTATVTPIKNNNVTFAMNFQADEATEAQKSYYGNWYADFVLTVNKDVTFNADGSADGWLAGQYDAYSKNWLKVPFNKSVSLKAGESVNIMELAAELMNKPGLRYTYAEVLDVVKDFNCGAYFNKAFLDANPDLEVTLELRAFNPADESENYLIGETYVFTLPELPTATATHIKNNNVTFAMNFKVDEVTEEQAFYYGNWYADFVLTANKDVTFNADGSADGWLAGQYDAYSKNWLKVPFNKSVSLKAGQSVNIMELAAELMNKPGLRYTYEEVMEVVKNFNCGVYFDKEFLDANPDLEVTLELRVFSPVDDRDSYLIGETYVFTLPELPTATVTAIEQEDLTFALNFKADEVTEEQAFYYGNWYADFVLTVNKDVTFNADGSADGWLAGQYDGFGENWLKVPYDQSVTIHAGESIRIMELAAQLLQKESLKLTYSDVLTIVKDFNCGVYFDEEFLLANPDLEVTLELKIFNPADESNGYVIGETMHFVVPNPVVAYNVNTDTYYYDLAVGLNELWEGETLKLLVDLTKEDARYTLWEGTFDLNGHSLTVRSLGAAFKGANVIDSSADNSGLLVTDRLSLYVDNAQLPIKTAEGYHFADVALQAAIRKSSEYVTFGLGMTNVTDQYLAQLLNDPNITASDVKLQYRVKIEWTSTSNSNTVTQYFRYRDDIIDTAAARWITSFTSAMTMKIYGTEDKNVTFTAQLVAEVNGSEIIFESAPVQS